MPPHQLPHKGKTTLVHSLDLVPALCFDDWVSLFSPGWPGLIHYVDQAGISSPPASFSKMLVVGFIDSITPAFDQCPARQKWSSLVLVF